jgi:hypothetical protein
MKIFVAYLLPHPTDVFNLLEDGIQWMAKGETKEQAEAALRALFDKTMKDDFYTEEEALRVWNQHDAYVAEV